MGRQKKEIKAKEPIRIRERKLANGNISLYLDVYQKGVRKYESLGLYLVPETSPRARQLNKEARQTAEKIKSDRILALQHASVKQWDKEGVLKATHDLLVERNTLFDDMVKKLDQYPELKELLRNILFEGKTRTFHTDEKYLQIGLMFNFLANNNGTVAIACRLMETRLYNLFIGENETSRIFSLGQMDKNQFVHDGFIDMRLLMERFCVHFNEIYRPGHDDQFVEDNGRKIFLTYLRPIINGIGNYYCEAQTRDLTRTDIIIDYLGQQYIIELKIWRGQSYNERGEKQLAEYLERYNLKTGYMVSFCFNKNKQSGLLPPVELNGRTLIEAIV